MPRIGRILFTCLLVLFLGYTLWGQGWRKPAVSAAKKLEGSLARDVAVRRLVSYNDEIMANNFLFTVRGGASPAFIRRNNLLVTAERLMMERSFRALRKQETAIKRALTVTLLDQVDGPALVDLIPAHKKYVFWGEVHGPEYSYETLISTLQAYKQRYPRRKLVLFSEFLHDDLPQPISAKILKTHGWYAHGGEASAYAVKHKIPLYGLEAGVWREKGLQEVELVDGETQTLPLAALSMEERNRHFLGRIRTIRQEYPDAVFFVYSGLLHTDYNVPGSVSAALAPEEIFVFSLTPNERFGVTPFDAALGYYLTPGLWTWQKNGFARLAGFDAAIVFPY